MNTVSELNLLYKELEKNALNYDCNQIRDLFKACNNNKDNQKRQWEIDCFSFRIQGNQLKPMVINANNEKYPDLDNFSGEAYKYFMERLHNTEHPLLKARYAHVLWFSPQKEKFSYAKKTVDAYLELIILYEAKNKQKPYNNFGTNLFWIIQVIQGHGLL